VLAWAPPVLWVLVLFVLSQFRSVPSPFQVLIIPSDKIIHFILYFILGGLLARAKLKSASHAGNAVLVALGGVYGVLDEWHQSFVPGRTPDAMDWLADMAGVTAGYTLVAVVSGSPSGHTTE
jgi:VanZ family protein